VLAATNRADLLDSALTRPGRFDRKITVPLPDRAAREQILRLYAAKRPMAPDVDLAALARRTPGMSGAELASLLNEASLVAGRRGARAVESPDVEDALGTVALGRERRGGLITERDRRITAWHEAGHTVAALLQEHAHDPAAVSIVPRGGAGGVTWMSGGDDAFTTRSQALADLVVSMAGRAAEELLLHGDYTQGACGDLTSATRTAHRMITQWGMSSLGMALRTPEWLTAGTHADRVQDETDAMLAAALDTARTLVVAELPFLRAVADRLLEEETLDGDAVREIARTVRGSDAPSAAAAQVGVFVPAPRASAAAGLVAATTPDSGAA
jgi:cell division protease FtsH